MVLSLKPGVAQNIALPALPLAMILPFKLWLSFDLIIPNFPQT